ncbi:CRISPR system precrRNA processing endoribonuclease RAMP protein Cas6 [candidate division KSB1 bacterium]|nr:CRISPR system precrRNA processing endoribonuclease RAMP protein Cas6 [candidate division KSB1 bacterium]
MHSSDDNQYSLPILQLFMLRIVFSAQYDCMLPGYKGAMLRGALGDALRTFFPCTFDKIFKPAMNRPSPGQYSGVISPPAPYVLSVLDTRQKVARNQNLIFSLTLIGQTPETLQNILHALKLMAQRGLGEKRVPFLLQSVLLQKTSNNSDDLIELYHSEKKAFLDPIPFTDFRYGSLKDKKIIIQVQTPLRIKVNKQLRDHINFHELIWASLNRHYLLCYYYHQPQEFDIRHHPLLKLSKDINIIEHNLYWVDLVRKSTTQELKMKIGGIVGYFTCEGSFGPFSQLLHTAEIEHLGGKTTFGNGKIKIIDQNR